jgi:enediyne biosynthesis protein E4
VVLGLGQAKSMDWLEVTWPAPSKRVERLTGLPLNTYVALVEGEAKPVAQH